MDRNFFALSLGLAGLALIPSLGRAAPTQCSAHDAVAAELSRQFAETPQAIGLGQDATVMELYASEQGTWTLTVTLPNGLTCLVAAGSHFETIKAPQTASGDPA